MNGRDIKGRFIKGHKLTAGKLNAFYGKPIIKPGTKRPRTLYSEQWRLKQSISQKRRYRELGFRGSGYKDGRSPVCDLIRKLPEYKEWRISVFKKNDFSCSACGIRNGLGKTITLEAHHIKPFRELMNDFLKEYSQFSPLEDTVTLVRLAPNYKPFWEISNGTTLCKDCHNKTKGRAVAWRA